MKSNSKNQKIVPFLWFDNRAEEAVEFYTSIFPNSRIDFLNRWPKGGPFPENSVQTAGFSLDGTDFYAFDAGPQFKFTPSISFFVVLETEEEFEALWKELERGGKVQMPKDQYPWSPLYGWVNDRFGLSWQLMLGKLSDVGQRVSPCLLFSGDRCGRAEEALRLQMSLFEDSSLHGISRYMAGADGPEGLVAHAQYSLGGKVFMAMDSGMEFEAPFNEAISLYVNCRDQEEVDFYWESLTAEGGAESQCGWLKDRFGISWQIIPEFLSDKISNGDPIRLGRMMEELWGMKKLDLAKLKEAYGN